MGPTFLIAARDLRSSVRSRAILVLGFVVPFGLALVFNLVFGGVDDSDINFELGLAVVDDGPAAEGFTELVDGIGSSGFLDVTTFDDVDGARAGVDDGEVAAAWVVPEGFSDAVSSGRSTEIRVIADVDAGTAATVAGSIASSYAASVETGSLAAAASVATGVASPEEAAEIAGDVAGGPRLARVADVETGPAGLDQTTEMIAGITVFFSFFLAGTPVLSLLRERDDGTLARLLAAPIPSGSITAGKAIAGVVTGVVSLVALMVATSVIMGAEWGPPPGALLLAVAVVLAASGVMTMAGSLAKSAEQAGNLQSIVAVSFGFLSGSFVPLPNADSGIVAALAQLTPNKWFLRGIGELGADGIGAAVPALLALTAIALVTGTIGVVLARRTLRS